MVYGPTKSSKSYITSILFHSYAAKTFAGYDFILASRSLKQANQVLLRYGEEWGQATGLGWKGVRTYYQQESLIGRPNRFHLALGSSERQADTVPGADAAGLLADEAPRMPERFVNHCLSRLAAIPGAKAILTGNPQGPGAWCYRRFGEGKAEPDHFAFSPADNPLLPSSWAEDMKGTYPYPGHAYDRMVLGLHTGAAGAVYPNLGDSLVDDWHRFGRVRRLVISADFAPATVTHAVLWAEFAGGARCAVAEWHWDGRERGQLTEAQQAARMLRKLNASGRVAYAVIDSAEKGFRSAVDQRMRGPVFPSAGDVEEGIQRVRLDLGRSLFIDRGRCPQLVQSMSGYTYDPVAGERGIDRPLKDGREHGADAARYYAYGRPPPSTVRTQRVAAQARHI